MYVTLNEKDGELFELMATVGKSGGTFESFLEALARQVSLSLRAGVDVDEVIDQLENIRSPELAWDDGDTVESIPDGIALAMKRWKSDFEDDFDNTDSKSVDTMDSDTYDPCPDCGTMLAMIEGCKSCPNDECGYSKC
jgi:ribonucleoside-diphosphate reductase alpha chain